MVVELNSTIQICSTNVHVYNISKSIGNPDRGKTYYQHHHPGIEIHYITAGQYQVACDGSVFTLNGGSMLLIPPGTYHDVKPSVHHNERICISFKLHKTEKADNKAESFYQAFNLKAPLIVDLQNTEAQQVLSTLSKRLDSAQTDIYKNDKLLVLCSNLLLELIVHIVDAQDNNPITQTANKLEDINYIIDSFIGTNFMYNNAKTRIASDLYVSPRQLQRIIQKNYGMSYRQKLSETRVQIATDLLRNSDMQIHKIAEILGYSCSANFSAFMKRATGKTPSQIRKNKNST